MKAKTHSQTEPTSPFRIPSNAYLKSIFIAAVLSAFAELGHAQILAYNFEGNATNSGTGGSTYNLTTTPASATYTTGVGGQGQALDLSANPVGGAAVTYGVGTSSYIVPAQTALTLTGWINVDEAFTATQSVILRDSATNSGFILHTGNAAGRLGLQVGNGTTNTTILSNVGSFGTSGQIGQWVFFAVSWDLATGSWAWYGGTETTAATLINSGTTVIGSMAAPSPVPNASLGRTNSGAGSFSGDLDALSLYGTALNATQVETLRASAVPEPSTYALLGLSGFVMLLLRRKSKRA